MVRVFTSPWMEIVRRCSRIITSHHSASNRRQLRVFGTTPHRICVPVCIP